MEQFKTYVYKYIFINECNFELKRLLHWYNELTNIKKIYEYFKFESIKNTVFSD